MVATRAKGDLKRPGQSVCRADGRGSEKLTDGPQRLHTVFVFSVLGGVRASTQVGPADLHGQVRRLLGILLAARGQAVATEIIVDRLWNEDAPRTATTAVHVVAGRLRRALEPDLRPGEASNFVVTTPDGYRLQSGLTDLDRYEDLIERAESSAEVAPESALTLVEDALQLWGRPWAEQANEPWLAPRVVALEERHRRAEELWAELVLHTGRGGEMIDRLRAAAESEPLREQRWRQLILALYRHGRQSEALRAYDDAQSVLRDQLGVDPGVDLQRLQLAVLEHDAILEHDPTEVATTATVTSFVGRVDELTWLTQSLARCRLLTVVGIGGLGKTRLVDEFAYRRRLIGQNVKRATFGVLTEEDRVLAHLANALGLDVDAEADAGALDVVSAAFGHRPGLLVLDAVEHVSEGVASVVLHLIERCPRLRIVVTSRVPLQVAGELTLALEPLPIGSADGPISGTALELLIDRAGLATTPLDGDMLARLRSRCTMTGGVPLLIELAAATATLSADRVQPTADHYVAVRESIRQAMECVDERACELVSDASVLPGGVSEETAAALRGRTSGDARRALGQLTWVHLVTAHPGLASMRYQSLDPVREALVEARPSADHAAAVARATDAVERVFLSIEPDALRPLVVARLDAAEDEHDNMRFLLAGRLRLEPRRALDLAIAGSLFWPVRGGAVQGRRWLEEAIAAAAPEGELAWAATLALTRTTRHFGEITQLRPNIESAINEMRAAGCADLVYLHLLGYLAMATGWAGDRAGAMEMLGEAERLTESLGSPWARAQLGKLQALDLAMAGDLAGARETQRSFARRLLDLGDELGGANSFYLSAALGDMAGAADVMDDIHVAQQMATATRDVPLLGQLLLLQARTVKRSRDPRARELLAQAVDRLTELGGIRAAALARRDLGLVELEQGDDTAARNDLQQALPMLLQLDRPAAALAAGGLAVLAGRVGNDSGARRLAEVAVGLRTTDAPESAEDTEQLGALLAQVGSRGAETLTRLDDDIVLELAGVTEDHAWQG